MKNYFIPFILVVIFLNFMSCNKDGDLSEPGAALQNRTTGIFQDTTGVEVFHILHLLNLENDSIEQFQQIYGSPSYFGTFHKKDDDLKITSIPMVKDNKITGIFKVFNNTYDSIRILFFPIEDMEMAIDSTLNSYDFQIYYGAIQSYLICSDLLDKTIDPRFPAWLASNKERVEERFRFDCLETWDCHRIIIQTKSSQSNLHYANWGYYTEQSRWKVKWEFCVLIEIECWAIDSPGPRTFTWFYGGTGHWNNFPWISTSAGGYLNNPGNNPNVKLWEAQLLLDAKDCIQESGIKGVMAKTGLEEAANNSCARSYNSLLVETYINLIEQNKDCTDGDAWMEEMENTKDKYEYEFFSDEVKDFFENNELIDPCTGTSIAEMLNDEACGSEEMLTMVGLEDRLEVVEPVNITTILNELGEIQNIFNNVGISNETLAAMENTCLNEYNPKCTDCSVNERNIVWQDDEKAKELLDCAISKLKNPDAITLGLMNLHFNSSSNFAVEYVKLLTQWIRFQSWNTDYSSVQVGSLGCMGTTTAWSYPLVQYTPIYLCNPTYWNSSNNERPITLIHEMFHLYYIAGDWAYDWEDDYEDLNTIQSLTNADSFATFIGQLCQ